MRRLAAAVTLVGSMAVATAACGGGSSAPKASSGSGSSGASAAFVSKGNSYCKSANDQQSQLKQPTDNTPTKWADYLGKFVNLANGLYSQLQGLTPPASKQAAFTTYLSNFDNAIGDARKAQQAAASGNSGAFQSAVQKVSSDGDKLDSEANALGLTECAKSSGNSGSSGSSNGGASKGSSGSAGNS